MAQDEKDGGFSGEPDDQARTNARNNRFFSRRGWNYRSEKARTPFFNEEKFNKLWDQIERPTKDGKKPSFLRKLGRSYKEYSKAYREKAKSTLSGAKPANEANGKFFSLRGYNYRVDKSSTLFFDEEKFNKTWDRIERPDSNGKKPGLLRRLGRAFKEYVKGDANRVLSSSRDWTNSLKPGKQRSDRSSSDSGRSRELSDTSSRSRDSSTASLSRSGSQDFGDRRPLLSKNRDSVRSFGGSGERGADRSRERERVGGRA